MQIKATRHPRPSFARPFTFRLSADAKRYPDPSLPQLYIMLQEASYQLAVTAGNLTLPAKGQGSICRVILSEVNSIANNSVQLT